MIAITGLGGHAFGSWRGRASTDRPIDRPMWLRDFLPVNFANIRIMTYGYDSSLKNPNGANLTDYRRNFRECLQNARRDCPVHIVLLVPHFHYSVEAVEFLTMLFNSLGTTHHLHRSQLGRTLNRPGRTFLGFMSVQIQLLTNADVN